MEHYRETPAHCASLRPAMWAFFLAAGILVLIVWAALCGQGCSLFQPAAAVAPVTPPVNVAQVVQKTLACVQSSVTPCMTQAPPLNNPQLCMALASAACAQVN
jgi:hypothetical protein